MAGLYLSYLTKRFVRAHLEHKENTMTQSVAERALSLLGKPGMDIVTNSKGIVTSVSFDLYGCVQIALTPTVADKANHAEVNHWLDLKRVYVDDFHTPVMQPPEFLRIENGQEPGPANKPSPRG